MDRQNVQISGNKYLTEDQAKHIYNKVELGSIINIDTKNKRWNKT